MAQAARREVEDDDGIAKPLVAALRSSGYEVTRVSSGQQALASADGVDAVVLDLQEDDHLVVRPLHQELKQGMLIGRAHGSQRSRARRSRSPTTVRWRIKSKNSKQARCRCSIT